MPLYIAYVVLVVFVAFLFGLGILISQIGENICLSPKCYGKADIMLSSLDSTVNPCDNFYKYICGNYGKQNEEGFSSMWEELESKQLWRLVRYLRPNISLDDDRVLKVAKNIYTRCTNLAEIEKEGLDPIMKALADSGGFPLLDENWNAVRGTKWNVGTAELLALITGFGTAHFLEMKIQKFEDDANRLYAFLSVPTSLKNIDKPDFDQYFKYSKEIYTVLYGNDSITNEKEKELNETIQFKINLLNLTKSTKNCSRESHNVMKSSKLRSVTRDLGDLNKLLVDLTDGVGDADMYVLTHGFQDYIIGLNNLIKNTTKRVAANYVSLEHIIQVTPFLPSRLKDIYNKYLSKKEDKANRILRNRNLHCAKLVKNQINTALSAVYLRDYYSYKKTSYYFGDLTMKIKTELKDMIKQVTWMDRKNKFETILKIDKVTFVTPLPQDVIERLINETAFDMYYTSLCLNLESTLSAYLSLGIVKATKNANSLIDDWYIFDEDYDIFSTDIYFDSERNTVVIPTGFLRYPAFDGGWPKYLNYGGLGSKIAHELIRGADFAGNKYGLEAEHSDWWSNYTQTYYQKKRLCFVHQYNRYIEPLAHRKVNDSNCVEANIADTAGVELSFLSYEQYSKERFFPEAKLPGFEKLTVNQHFFIDFAYFYCTKFDIEYKENMTEAEVGEPSNEYKVVGSLKNFPKFSETFKCKQGDKMNPSNKCNIW